MLDVVLDMPRRRVTRRGPERRADGDRVRAPRDARTRAGSRLHARPAARCGPRRLVRVVRARGRRPREEPQAQDRAGRRGRRATSRRCTASGTGLPMTDESASGRRAHAGGRRRGPAARPGGPARPRRRRFMRRVALLVACSSRSSLPRRYSPSRSFAAALGDASGTCGCASEPRLSACSCSSRVWLVVGRSVRRMFGPIGEVMEAADRVADGDYSTRVAARGPGEVRRLGRPSTR